MAGQHSDIDHTGLPGVGAAAVKACRVTRNADMSISSGGTAVAWDNEVRDDGGFWDGGAPTRLTVPDDAWYSIHATGNNASSSADFVSGLLRVDGSTIIDRGREYETTNSVSWSVKCSAIIYLTAGQYVEFLLDVGASVSAHGETAVPGYLNMSIAKLG